MTVRVGVIGVGMIGADHVRRLTTALAGATVTALTDIDATRAATVAARFGGVTVHASGQEVIGDASVDALVVTSSGPTHEEYVLASIAAGKPVFCEKPLATTAGACWRIIEAETAARRRLVQVGFMRRYDAAYRELKSVARGGSIGAPLLLHLAHRNPVVPPAFTTEMVITDSAVHEVDLTRWLLDSEIASVMVLRPKRSSRAAPGLQDPMVIELRTADGVLVDVELSFNVGYGYEIRGEVVGESGNVQLADGGDIVVTSQGGRGAAVPPGWRERFIRAYDTELQEWVNGVADQREADGPSSWDGYAATVVTEACIAALEGDGWVDVALRKRPALYASHPSAPDT